MPEVKRHIYENFVKFIEIIERFQKEHDTSWYRGVGKSTHGLRPSIFRHPTKKKVNEIQTLEIELASAFEQRTLPIVDQTFNGGGGCSSCSITESHWKGKKTYL